MSRSSRCAPLGRFAAGIFSEVQIAMNLRCNLIRTSGSTFKPHRARCTASSLAASGSTSARSAASALARVPGSGPADSDSLIDPTLPNGAAGANTEGSRSATLAGPSPRPAWPKASAAASPRQVTLVKTVRSILGKLRPAGLSWPCRRVA